MNKKDKKPAHIKYAKEYEAFWAGCYYKASMQSMLIDRVKDAFVAFKKDPTISSYGYEFNEDNPEPKTNTSIVRDLLLSIVVPKSDPIEDVYAVANVISKIGKLHASFNDEIGFHEIHNMASGIHSFSDYMLAEIIENDRQNLMNYLPMFAAMCPCENKKNSIFGDIDWNACR